MVLTPAAKFGNMVAFFETDRGSQVSVTYNVYNTPVLPGSVACAVTDFGAATKRSLPWFREARFRIPVDLSPGAHPRENQRGKMGFVRPLRRNLSSMPLLPMVCFSCSGVEQPSSSPGS